MNEAITGTIGHRVDAGGLPPEPAGSAGAAPVEARSSPGHAGGVESARTTALYTVKPGDTLSRIAAATGVRVSDIARANAITNPDRIAAGQQLHIVRQGSPHVVPAITGSGIKATANLDRLVDPAQGARAPAAVAIGKAQAARVASGLVPAAAMARVDHAALSQLAARLPAYIAASERAGLPAGMAALALAYCDLHLQAPSAAARLLGLLGQLSANGLSNEAIAALRVSAFLDAATGQRSCRDGTDYVAITTQIIGKSPSEAQIVRIMRADQLCSQSALMNAIDALAAGDGGANRAGALADGVPIGAELGVGAGTPRGAIDGLDPASLSWVDRHQQRGPAAREDSPDLPGHDVAAGRGTTEIDIHPFRSDGRNAPVSFVDPAYDRAATRGLIERIRMPHPHAVILFNDPVLIAHGLTLYAAGYDSWLHVRF